jgi:hypothetical protein
VDWFKESVERDILRERLNRLMMGNVGNGFGWLGERFKLDIGELFNIGNLSKILQNGALRGTEGESAYSKRNDVNVNDFDFAYADVKNSLNFGKNSGAGLISSNADNSGFGKTIDKTIDKTIGNGFIAQSAAFGGNGLLSLISEYNPNRAINRTILNQTSNTNSNHYPNQTTKKNLNLNLNLNHYTKNFSDKTYFPTYSFWQGSNSEENLAAYFGLNPYLGLTDNSGNEVSVKNADISDIAEGIPQVYGLSNVPLPKPLPLAFNGGNSRLSGDKELAAAVIRMVKSDTERIINSNSYSSNGLTESKGSGLGVDFGFGNGFANANGNTIGNGNGFAIGQYAITQTNAINTNSIVNQSANNSLGSIPEENTYTKSSSDFGADEAVEAVIEYLVRELNGGV